MLHEYTPEPRQSIWLSTVRLTRPFTGALSQLDQGRPIQLAPSHHLTGHARLQRVVVQGDVGAHLFS